MNDLNQISFLAELSAGQTYWPPTPPSERPPAPAGRPIPKPPFSHERASRRHHPEPRPALQRATLRHARSQHRVRQPGRERPCQFRRLPLR
jgi:hypothetical protein